MEQTKVSKLWKESIIVVVTKIKSLKKLNVIRPVALVSLVMKSFERLVKQQLKEFQVYWTPCNVLIEPTGELKMQLTKHLTKPHARLLFIDFSSAFNTIQLHISANKLSFSNLDVHFHFHFTFILITSQRVRVNGTLS